MDGACFVSEAAVDDTCSTWRDCRAAVWVVLPEGNHVGDHGGHRNVDHRGGGCRPAADLWSAVPGAVAGQAGDPVERAGGRDADGDGHSACDLLAGEEEAVEAASGAFVCRRESARRTCYS